MAEGLAKKYFKNFTIKSAGTNPEPINSLAIEVMKELNIDLSNNYSKSMNDSDIKQFDMVITLCGDAKDQCIVPQKIQKEHIHWDIEDPAKYKGSYENKLNIFRIARDKIKENIENLNEKIYS
tara:strand:+ start:2487 stop:2855 length:369 start_codon:yes stop_codon:yes gene_type:complete